MMTFGVRNTFALLILVLLAAPAHAQTGNEARRLPADTTAAPMPSPVAATPGVRLKGYRVKQKMMEESMLAAVPFEGAGPTIMSGRVVDLAVNPADPTEFYVAYASGGLWHTTNNGRTFTPLFDDQPSMTLGDIAVDWASGGRGDGQTIWVGTGENNSSRSSYAGTGLYKSTDRGRTWEHVGLSGTHRTGRIVLHPGDPQTVWVAALGPLYHPSDDRGVYKTTDGGETWEKTLYVNDNTGAIDLEVNPDDPRTLYASMWHRERRAWNFVEAGAGTGLYKSTDGGETWSSLSTGENGFPAGPGVGRIGIALYPQNPDVLYALVDNQYRQPEEEEEKEEPPLTKDILREMSKTAFLKVGEEALEDYLRRNGFPASYTAESILEMVREGTIAPIDLVHYLEDANAQLFDTPVVGAQVYRSDDGGQSWKKTHAEPIDEMYYSYGYYFGQIRVHPRDDEKVYIMGVPLLRSDDGGQTFQGINEEHVHVDHHALWVNPNRPGHLINGNDGGVNVSYDDGESWFKNNTPPVGQFYTVQYDMEEPYNVYGGLQDNGVWGGPHTYEQSYEWRAEGDYPYDRLLGGDGMMVEVDTREDHPFVYTGYQFGYYYRINRETGERTSIKPQHALGERPLRFNWMTPIHLSRHNQDVLYLGSNKLHRSLNRGEDWETLSGDLTGGGVKGDVPYGTLTTIDESPFKFGLLWVGSDDGRVHFSRDGGTSWQDVSDGLPDDLWVSRVEASHHEKERVYATLNGYRYDHFRAYVYRSDDYGLTWERIGKDLPPEPVNVIVEDPVNEDVLYVGTDHSVYVSLDRGETFMPMGGRAEGEHRFPSAPVHALKVHPRERDLIVGTHGRSIYIADVAPIQQLTPALRQQPAHLFDTDSLRYRESWGEAGATWMEPSSPAVMLTYYAREAGPAALRIQAEDGTVLRTLRDTARRGLNYVRYDLAAEPGAAEVYAERQRAEQEEDEEGPVMEPASDGKAYLTPGTYTVEVETAAGAATGTLTVAPAEPRRRGVPGPEELNETRGRG